MLYKTELSKNQVSTCTWISFRLLLVRVSVVWNATQKRVSRISIDTRHSFNNLYIFPLPVVIHPLVICWKQLLSLNHLILPAINIYHSVSESYSVLPKHIHSVQNPLWKERRPLCLQKDCLQHISLHQTLTRWPKDDPHTTFSRQIGTNSMTTTITFNKIYPKIWQERYI